MAKKNYRKKHCREKIIEKNDYIDIILFYTFYLENSLVS